MLLDDAWNCLRLSCGVSVDLKMYLLFTFFSSTFRLNKHTNTQTNSAGMSVCPPEAATVAAESPFETLSSPVNSKTSHGAHPASYLGLMDTGHLWLCNCELSGHGVKPTADVYLIPRLRMGGAIHHIPLPSLFSN